MLVIYLALYAGALSSEKKTVKKKSSSKAESRLGLGDKFLCGRLFLPVPF